MIIVKLHIRLRSLIKTENSFKIDNDDTTKLHAEILTLGAKAVGRIEVSEVVHGLPHFIL